MSPGTLHESDYDFFIRLVGGKEEHTIGEFFNAVLKVKEPLDMLRFYRGATTFYAKQGEVDDPAECAQFNIGYAFGEGMDQETINKWHSLTGAENIWFGHTLPDPSLTFEQAQVIAMEKVRELIARFKKVKNNGH
jgi:hypothetical protein